MSAPHLVIQADADEDQDLLDCCCALIPGIHAAGACAQIDAAGE
jgi:hypothetical protein